MMPGISGFAGWATAPGTSGGGSPPTSDPYWSNVVLLLSGDGANGSTTFTDEASPSRGNATVGGNTQVSTSGPKFGTGSILFDGTGDNLTYSDSPAWGFGASPFTIEAWVKFASGVDSDQCIVSQWLTGTFQRAWVLQYDGGMATNQLRFSGSSAGTSTDLAVSGNWTPTLDTWYHIAVDRSGNVFRLYVDGAMLASTTSTINLFNSDTGLRIGNINSSGETNYLNGRIDELRITKGVARYASDSGFSVPTAAFPRS